MGHTNLDCTLRVLRPGLLAVTRWPSEAIVQHPNVAARNDLSQPPILGVSHFNIIFIEEEEILPEHGGTLRFLLLARVFHDERPAHLAVLVDIDRTVLVGEQEFLVIQLEHPERR